jgi:hypothetical protein
VLRLHLIISDRIKGLHRRITGCSDEGANLGNKKKEEGWHIDRRK